MKRSARQILLLSILASIVISFNIGTTSTYADTFHFSEPLAPNQTPTPKIILTFDDGTVDHYTNVLPLLKQYNLQGTFYVVTDCLMYGCALYPDAMTTGQALEMYSAGMDIANHTKSHTALKSSNLSSSEIDSILSMYSSEPLIDETEFQFEPLSISQIEEELQGARLALDSLGMTRASRHVAYPFGIYDENVLTVMKNIGMLTGRTTKVGIDNVYDIYTSDKLFELSVREVVIEDDLQKIKNWIDDAIVRDATLILVFHHIVDDPINKYEFSLTTFTAILDYLVDTGVKSQTITEWYSDYLDFARTQPLFIYYLPVLFKH